MKNAYLRSLLTSLLSIVPMIAVVMILSAINVNGTRIVTLKTFDYVALIIGLAVMVFGLSTFKVGASNGLEKVGQYMGSSLSKQKNLFIVILFSFLLGSLITCAEPSILIISTQIQINSVLLISIIAVGVGIFVAVGVMRIIFHGNLKVWYIFFYLIVFMLVSLVAVDESTRKFLPFIFDAGGITTGSATVPFILAVGAGVATVSGGRQSTENSFGLVGIASVGPIISMTLLILINRTGFSPYVVPVVNGFGDMSSIGVSLLNGMLGTENTFGTVLEVAMALAPIIVIFGVYEAIFIKMNKKQIGKLLVGFLYSYIGLVIFLTGINAIMSPFGTLVGEGLGNAFVSMNLDWVIILICFAIGLVTVLCEPAVHVLTKQIVDVSDGAISKKTIIISLSLGVGAAIGLSALRTLLNFDILWIIVPGYLLCIALTFATPNIFVAMAFDAGGTASGPMSVSFVLPMIIGITKIKYGYGNQPQVAYYTQSFGVVALIALIPILTVEILGTIHKMKKLYHLRIMAMDTNDPNDAQIIHF